MIYWDVEQGSAEWLKLRLGRVTASRVKDVMGTKAKRSDYLWELVTERLTGQAEEHFVNDAMRWGTECEPIARVDYEMEHCVTFKRPGFATHESIPWFGASPDGLADGWGIEIKCPKPKTHLKWKLDGVLPDEHRWQVLANMSVFGADAWHFRSFDPRLPEEFQRFDVWVKREGKNEGEILQMEDAIKTFLTEVEQTIERLK